MEKMETNEIDVINVLENIEDFLKKTKKNILKSRNKELSYEEIYSLRNQGWTLAKIANKFAVSPSHIFQILRK
jgi:Mor family transcriptional regulator